MKQAYLILAHHQPQHLARLASRLLSRESHLFIHIDRRSDLEPFRKALGQIESPWLTSNLHFVAKRHKVVWFGYSTVEATLTLMNEASRYGDFSYYSLLSGVDYPIKTNSVIQNVLSGDQTEYLAYWRLEDRPAWQPKIEHYWLTDHIPLRDLRRPGLLEFWKLRTTIPYLYWVNFTRYKKMFPKRRFPFPDIHPYGGSQWWSLTEGCVKFVLDFVARHPDFSRFYRFTQCPDEMFFQTIVMNSKFAQNAAHWEPYQKWRAAKEVASDETMLPDSMFNLRYIDFDVPWGGERGYPALLDDRDYDPLTKSPALFARKFDPVRSRGLLDRIDVELLGLSNETHAGSTPLHVSSQNTRRAAE